MKLIIFQEGKAAEPESAAPVEETPVAVEEKAAEPEITAPVEEKASEESKPVEGTPVAEPEVAPIVSPSHFLNAA